MNGTEVGVAVIGAGRAGLLHAANFAGRVPGSRLIGLADPAPGSREAAGQRFPAARVEGDYAVLLRDPQVGAVVIAAPTRAHAQIAVAAARAGRHILCEKPMAMTQPECDAMIDAAARHDVRLQIGFMRRFDARFAAAKQKIERGEIGDLVLVKSLTHGPSTPRRWQYDIGASNGALAEVNSHDIDTLRWFTGSEFEQVYAMAGNFRCPEARTAFPAFYDNVVMTASFRNGMQGFIGGALSVGYGYDARVEALGARGVLFVGQPPERTSVAGAHEAGSPPPRSWRDLFRDAYLAQDTDFVACIQSGRPPRVTGFDGKMAVAVVEAGNRSIREGRPIRLCGERTHESGAVIRP
ncbi:MAG: Gfo/Idh/MocA family oxidoreductase [Kiritimatiellae bacterium]|nr:Gfo/Idh/MocA family oxidoreductase [Kiritimatiellia bacterium]